MSDIKDGMGRNWDPWKSSLNMRSPLQLKANILVTAQVHLWYIRLPFGHPHITVRVAIAT